MSSKRIKEIVKNAEPAKGTNADPGQLGQYSATNQVSEDGSLNQYLSSRGINPKFVSKETKISHAKSSTFQKWKNDHRAEEVENEEPLVEDALLDKFLSSRGINPKYVTKNMKVAHAKSGEFIKWKNDHKFESVVIEETDKKDMVCMDIPLLIRVLEFTREEMSSDIELHNMVERLINMRNNVPLDMAHYDEITQKLVKENHIAIAMGKMLDDESGMVLSQLEQLERGIAMVRSYIGKDYEKQLPAWVQAKITLATDYVDTVGNYIVSKNEKVNEDYAQGVQGHVSQATMDSIKNKHNVKVNLGKPTYNPKPKTLVKKPAKKVSFLSKLLSKEEIELEEAKTTQSTALDKFRKAATEREKKHNEIEKIRQEKLHQDPSQVTVPVANTSKDDMTSAIDRLEKHLNKEENEQIDEITQTDIDKSSEKEVAHAKKHGWKVQQQTYGRTYTHPKHGHIDMNRYGEWQHRPQLGIMRGKGNLIAHGDFKDLDKHISSLKEDVFQDPQAATQTAFDNGTSTNDKQEGMSKSARLVKSIYKKFNMKEDTYDWEKDDKNQTSPGKKMQEPKEKPDARAILTGGKTLTGEKRDTLEIDPMMKNRPDLNGNLKDNENTKKNNKINN
jgi:hypothetical protein